MIIGESLVLSSQSFIYDPVNGPELEQVWRGTRNAVAGLASGLNASGYRCRQTDESGAASLTVSIPQTHNDGKVEAPTDKFNITTDYIQTPIWDSRPIMKELTSISGDLIANGISRSTSDLLGLAREIIDPSFKGKVATSYNAVTYKVEYNQLRDGPLTLEEANFEAQLAHAPWAITYGLLELMNKIYGFMLRGGNSIEEERPILKWVRTYSINYAARRRIPDIPSVYTTEAMVRDFLIPATIQAMLPVNPTWKPDNTNWAWKERARDSEVDWFGKVTDTVEFVFAAWADYYTLVT